MCPFTVKDEEAIDTRFLEKLQKMMVKLEHGKAVLQQIQLKIEVAKEIPRYNIIKLKFLTCKSKVLRNSRH